MMRLGAAFRVAKSFFDLLNHISALYKGLKRLALSTQSLYMCNLSGGGRQALAVNRRDWLLSAIAQAVDKGLSPIQIQKTMFLLKMEASEHVGTGFYTFEPYNYGPFSSIIYGDVDFLVASGLVREESAGSFSRFIATEAGRDRASSLASKVDEEANEYLRAVVRWVLSVDFRQLVRSIYAKYPDYAKNSVFRR